MGASASTPQTSQRYRQPERWPRTIPNASPVVPYSGRQMYEQGFTPSRSPSRSPARVDYGPGMGYTYRRGSDFTPVIPRDYEHLRSPRQVSMPRPVIPRPTPTSQPMTPVAMQRSVIPQESGYIQTQALSPRPRSERRPSIQPLAAERQGGQGEYIATGEYVMSPRLRERGSAGKRTPRDHNLMDGPGQNQLGRDEHNSSRAHREYPQPLPTDVHLSHHSPPVREHQEEVVEPIASDQRERSTSENEVDNPVQGNQEPRMVHDVQGSQNPSGRSRINRIQTPFHRPRSLERDEESIESSDSVELPSRILSHPHRSDVTQTSPQTHQLPSPRQRRSASSYSNTTDSRTTPSTSPTTPNSQSQVGPSRAPYLEHQSRPNPLPPPPFDIFSLPKYAQLLNPAPAPQVNHNGVPNGQGFVVNTVDVIPSPVQKQEKKKKKSIFRSLSLRKSPPSSSPPLAPTPVQYVVVSRMTPPQNTIHASNVAMPTPPQAQPVATHSLSDSQPVEASLSTSVTSQDQTRSLPTITSAAHPHETWPMVPVASQSQASSRPSTLANQSNDFPGPGPGPVPVTNASMTGPPSIQSSNHQTHDGQQPEPPCIIFDQNSEHSYFLMHSRHRVSYEDQLYPTAAHLLEALKFLPGKPEIAERIRQCEDPAKALDISAKYARYADPAFAVSVVENTYKVMTLKFRQHADLRYALDCMDNNTKFIYNDPSDSFWGIGYDGNGDNELGKVLVRVLREVKLRRRRV